ARDDRQCGRKHIGGLSRGRIAQRNINAEQCCACRKNLASADDVEWRKCMMVALKPCPEGDIGADAGRVTERERKREHVSDIRSTSSGALLRDISWRVRRSVAQIAFRALRAARASRLSSPCARTVQTFRCPVW